jgi:2',3'-cyclic-nucleotide 2'-phosphodiesterase (5'-nucleotidase family)
LLLQKQKDMEALCQEYEQKLADARSEIVRTNQGNLKSRTNISDDESTLLTSATENELAEYALTEPGTFNFRTNV